MHGAPASANARGAALMASGTCQDSRACVQVQCASSRATVRADQTQAYPIWKNAFLEVPLSIVYRVVAYNLRERVFLTSWQEPIAAWAATCKRL
jgi:hypothetical protein